jgi:hypothetical protein
MSAAAVATRRPPPDSSTARSPACQAILTRHEHDAEAVGILERRGCPHGLFVCQVEHEQRFGVPPISGRPKRSR